jgi:hypothetical protein
MCLNGPAMTMSPTTSQAAPARTACPPVTAVTTSQLPSATARRIGAGRRRLSVSGAHIMALGYGYA